ncbi:thiol-disulfide oxidoreductase DCC family protein [Viridibacillus sp. FSL H8-0110]|uniref:thiol-disulfide oxidoreductase DCC family protein n=1 Tax=Viridibacillus sp. FSL H8-0110 TaxID=2921376 RepID=UPI0030F8F506
MTNHQNPILFYDGSCGFCQWAVQFVLKHERNHDILFAPLQGETAKNTLSLNLTKNLDSVVVKSPAGILTESEAVFFLLPYLKTPFSLFTIFKLIPLFARNPVYRLVARNRHKLMKAPASCHLPSLDERKRLLP